MEDLFSGRLEVISEVGIRFITRSVRFQDGIIAIKTDNDMKKRSSEL